MKFYIENIKITKLKNSISNWENWLKRTVHDRHFCSENQWYFDAAILAVTDPKIINSPRHWIWSNVWLADKEEIYDGEAEYIGELMSSSHRLIFFCPYCGTKLQDPFKAE